MALILSFFVYSFMGWIIEVLYYMYKEKRFVNRGFLNGPVVPIYGTSMVFLHIIMYSIYPSYSSLYPLHVVTVFLFVIILSSLLELFGGVLLYKVFETRWWDYSHLKFNYKGFICLRFSLLWGIMGTIGFSFLHHYQIYPLLSTLNENMMFILNTTLVIVFFIDWMLTVITLLNFKKMLLDLKRRVASLSKDGSSLREQLGSTRFNVLRTNINSIVTNFKSDERFAKIKSKIDQLKDFFTSPKIKEERREFESLRRLSEKITSSRLYKAFPELKLALREDDDDDENNKDEISNE